MPATWLDTCAHPLCYGKLVIGSDLDTSGQTKYKKEVKHQQMDEV